MKKYFLLIAIFALSFSGLHAASSFQLTRQNIMVTDQGFVVNVDGHLFPAETITYLGNGIYNVSQTYYGSCGRCGWALDKNGNCPNQNCHGYGPRERD